MLYLILFVILFSFSLIELQGKKIHVSWHYVMPLVLIFFTAARMDTGTDYASYLKLWTEVEPLTDLIPKQFKYAELEAGFVFLMGLLKQMTTSAPLFWAYCATIIFIPFCWGLKKLPIPYYFVALLGYLMTFYIPYTFNGIRQAIAMSVFVACVPFILQRKTITVILLTALATSVHLSGLLILLAYIVQFYRWNLLPVMILGTLVALLVSQLNMLNYVLFEVLGISKVYVVKFTAHTSLFKLATRALLLLLFFGFYQQADETYRKIFTMYLLGFFIYVALAENNMLATRFNMFFRILELLMLPLLLVNISQLKKRIMVFCLFLIPYAYSFISSAMHPDNQYHFIFAMNELNITG